MKVKIDVEVQTLLKFAYVVLAFVFGVFLIIQAKTPLTIIAVSVFLALALNPSVSYIANKLPGRSRIGGSALAYLMVIFVLASTVFFVTPPLVEQSSKFASTVPQVIDLVTDQRYLVDDFVTRYGLEEQLNNSIESAKNQATAIAENIGKLFVDGAGAIFNGALNVILILVLTFFMLIEGPSWMTKIWGLYHDPRKLERHRSVIQKMYRVVVGYVNGQMFVALIAAVCAMIAIIMLSMIFDLPANLALPMAAIVFLTSLIPMVGATLGGIIVALVLVLNDVTAAIIFVIYFVIYQQIENNVISPAVQSKQVELSALAVLISIIIGVSFFGILGGIISIPIAGCIRILLVDYLEHAEKERNEKSRPISKLVNKIRESKES